ncbi:diguanylate cyclase/phosphodiesterase [Franzmannia pantelleriensis]|uniref:Diguanylate cyclase/phosphodiesterase n=1 Tax=Franzmannia pantelleriensis TaxID=48727 RepID=A0A1G9EH37_9GAMM|nr:bifunctional diguanylate cyclase/phosphodiesterase [Halomonas pantelleriensis]SDK75398.1 diguanylate cyclase/phosphodiesterase [Halomonas pantelleriensis]
MDTSVLSRFTQCTAYRRFEALPPHARQALLLLVLALLLALGTLVVYLTGGTRYAYPYLMLVPVLMAAAFFGLSGALVAGLAAGGLMAVMPLDTITYQSQPTFNWVLRMGLYLFIAGVAGSAFSLLKHAHAASEIIARRDPSSGLPNQVALEEALSRRLAYAGSLRQGVGLILIRITDIADVLEALGPEASDTLVKTIAERMRHQDPLIVDVYRFSGAEIFVLLDGSDPERFERIASRLVEAGEENLIVQDVPLRVQLALGSSYRSASEQLTPEELIRRSRIALLAAVQKHRSHCHYSKDMASHTLDTVKLIAKVRRGLEEGQFELHYQPKLRLADGQICGCEGLIRWRNEDGELISPASFMPKVESTSLINPVTRFVAQSACRFATQHTGVVSINLSVRNLQDSDLVDEIKALVTRNGIEPQRLEVEITESALMHDMFIAKQALESLRRFGVRVSIDDFGTGFSSFEYLQHLPITGLKIDRAFVKNLASSERAQRLMACLIDVGHALSLEVTAEGVETLEQHRILCRLGCDQAQGFLYARPLHVVDYAHWCDEHVAASWPTLKSAGT